MLLGTMAAAGPGHSAGVTLDGGIDRRDVRPSRAWFVVAALIAAGVAAAALFLATVAPGGTVEQRFSGRATGEGGAVARTSPMVWVRAGESTLPDLRCTAQPLGFTQNSAWRRGPVRHRRRGFDHRCRTSSGGRHTPRLRHGSLRRQRN